MTPDVPMNTAKTPKPAKQRKRKRAIPAAGRKLTTAQAQEAVIKQFDQAFAKLAKG